MLDCLPISCTMLIRELHDQIEKNYSEQCFEETSRHLENAESDVEGEPAHIGTPPLDYNPFQITQEEWHPDNVEKTTHEPCIQTEYHNNHEELFETEKDQETMENPQIFPAITHEDPLEEAQEDIRPQNQLTQEKKDCCTSVLRKKKIPSLLTEEEIDLILNRQPTSKPSFE